MTVKQAYAKLRQAVRTGYVPEGITIRWMDWAKGSEGRVNEGHIDGALLEDLRVFYKAMMSADIRVEKV
jgi:hypothetical protein